MKSSSSLIVTFFAALAVVTVLTGDVFVIEIIYRPNDCPILSQNGDLLTTHYTAYWENGTAFETSVGGEPFQFTLGAGEVIKGWDLGLVNMCVLERRRLTLPPDYAYGPNGSSDGFIPPNATLIFDVELLDISRP